MGDGIFLRVPDSFFDWGISHTLVEKTVFFQYLHFSRELPKIGVRGGVAGKYGRDLFTTEIFVFVFTFLEEFRKNVGNLLLFSSKIPISATSLAWKRYDICSAPRNIL